MDEDSSVSIGLEQTAKPPRKRQRPKGLRRALRPGTPLVEHDYPQLHVWRDLARDWLKGETEAVHIRLAALTSFLRSTLSTSNSRSTLPYRYRGRRSCQTLYAVACPDSNAGVSTTTSSTHF